MMTLFADVLSLRWLVKYAGRPDKRIAGITVWR